MRPQIFQFALVGATSTAIDFLLLNLFVSLGFNLYVALFLSYLAGAVNGYLFNNRWTFGHLEQPHNLPAFLRYAGISFVGLGLTELVVYALQTAVHTPINLNKIVAVGVVFFWNYFANRHFTFKEG